MGHQFAIVPVCDSWLKPSKTNRDLISLQALEVAIIVNFCLENILLFRYCSLNDHGVSVR